MSVRNQERIREESRPPNYVAKSVSKEDNKNGECKRRINSQGWQMYNGKDKTTTSYHNTGWPFVGFQSSLSIAPA